MKALRTKLIKYMSSEQDQGLAWVVVSLLGLEKFKQGLDNLWSEVLYICKQMTSIDSTGSRLLLILS